MIHDLARGLVRTGHIPRVIASHQGPPSQTTDQGLTVVRTRRVGNRVAARLGYHEHVGHLPFQYAALRSGQEDIAHAFYVTDAIGAARWSRRNKKVSVFTVMGVAEPERIDKASKRWRLWRRGLERADEVLALSDAARKSMGVFGIEPTVIHPGVDLAAFRPAANRSERPTILCASDAGDPRKRVRLLIEAHAMVRRLQPDTRLVLSKPTDDKLAAELVRSPGVSLLDLNDHSQLVQHYSAAWATVLPSRAEAFGLVLAESLACGTPVVGANDGGIPEIVGDQRVGALFDGGAESLADAIAGALRISQSADIRERCRQRASLFSIDRCVDAHVELYSRLLGRGLVP
jgi:phosphatidylinositol alpha-mannosyltransferase